jgi:hypothetical protein
MKEDGSSRDEPKNYQRSSNREVMAGAARITKIIIVSMASRALEI